MKINGSVLFKTTKKYLCQTLQLRMASGLNYNLINIGTSHCRYNIIDFNTHMYDLNTEDVDSFGNIENPTPEAEFLGRNSRRPKRVSLLICRQITERGLAAV